MFTRNTDVNIKLDGSKYAWDRFDKEDVLKPHFNFLEGKKANERREAAAMRHEAREKN